MGEWEQTIKEWGNGNGSSTIGGQNDGSSGGSDEVIDSTPEPPVTVK